MGVRESVGVSYARAIAYERSTTPEIFYNSFASLLAFTGSYGKEFEDLW